MTSALTCSAKGVEAADIESLFNRLFERSENTVLRGGACEPLYEPATDVCPAIIRYREDYVASALHEVAHWCIAGPSRREQLDYGYWYDPDGRTGSAQQRFQAAEARPQALEWCFSQAAGLSFRISLDNLATPPLAQDIASFTEQVVQAGELLREAGLPPRGEVFFHHLCVSFNPSFRRARLAFDRRLLQ